MSTIDGKITGGDGTDILSEKYFELYTRTENMLPPHTAWMCGRVTMQMFANGSNTSLPALTEEIESVDYIAPHEGNLFMFGVDTKGLLRWDTNTIKLSNVDKPLHLVMVVTLSTPKEYLQYLQHKGISYLVTGENDIEFQRLFTAMKEKFGVETLLLEGGAVLNGSVMAADFVDEISLLVTPTIINRSQAPSVFERKQSEPIDLRHFSLLDMKKLDKGAVWLRYRKLDR